jgi:thiol:disulfide interchange protein
MKPNKTKFATLFLSLILALLTTFSNAQILKPVHWTYSTTRFSAESGEIIFNAAIDKGWHLYSQFIPANGPVATSFSFDKNNNFQPEGKISESKSEEVQDPNFGMKINFFSGKAVFKQKVKVSASGAFKISGKIEFMVCDDKQCLPPEELPFTVEMKNFQASTTLPKDDKTNVAPVLSTPDKKDSMLSGGTKIEPAISKPEIPVSNSAMPFWSIFLGGFLGGLLALLTPCVFPMIPLTVSFFTKQAKNNKTSALSHALLYGASIVVIYVALGFGVTKALGGADALNDLASNAVFNLIFFVMLTVFAISFLGAFEIQLPSSWINKADAKSDKGGIVGIFFMAFTLALVSFSCTGPIIGTLLVQAAHSNNYLGPLLGMTGFSIALALPFTLFAAFPSWMHSLPKSGGWLNSVKVVLGFLELAFALKFLSNVDLAYHWRILDREIFLVLWIIIFALLGLYLLGKLKFSHDSDMKYVSLPRFFLALFSFAFTLYMVPGLWGAPLKAISAFTPPQASLDFDLTVISEDVSTGTASKAVPKKNAHLFHCPHNLNCYFDYEEGIEYAKKINKPVLLDFTGWSCSNCRKMEASVWSDPAVLKRLKENFVIISLYVDDKTELLQNEKFVSKKTQKSVNTLGNKWSELQVSKFEINSQPYYALLDHQGNVLVPARGFDLNIDNYILFLDQGYSAFKNKDNTSH